MEKYAITISRQFASMGRSIAQELAEQLHIEFLDRDIVDETAKRMNASIRQISDEEEGISSKFSYRMYPLGLGVPAVKDELFKVQQSIMPRRNPALSWAVVVVTVSAMRRICLRCTFMLLMRYV